MSVFTSGKAGGAAAALVAACILIGAGSGLAEDFEWKTYLDPNNPVDVVVSAGEVWLASTTGAATVYDISDSSFTAIHRRPGRLASNSLIKVVSDADGMLWFGTSLSGVSVLDPETSQWDLLTRFEGLPSDNVLDMAVWGDSVWVGTPSGFAVFSDGELAGRCNESVPPESRCPLESFRIQVIAPLADGAYLGTDAGVSWFDGENETPLGRPWLLGAVKDLAALDGEPWVLTSSGVHRWDSVSSVWVDDDEGLPSPGAFRSLSVIEGELYAAGPSGVYKREATNWAIVGSGFNAMAVAGSSDEGLWAAGIIGLYGLSGGAWTRIPAPGPNVDDTRSVAVGREGEVWISGPFWVNRFDGENWELISASTTDYRLQQCDTHGLLVDSQNRIWFGHCCRRNLPDSCLVDRLTRVESPRGWRRFDAGNIWRVTEGGGAIWLAGRYEGLYRLQDGESEPVRIGASPGRLSSNLLSSLAFEPGGGLWIGHRQEGVDFYGGAVSGDPGDWDHIDESDGLVSNSVRKVMLKGGRLWVGTINGVSVVDRASMSVVRNYTVGPGGIEDRIIDVSGMAVDGLGDVWVTTVVGGVYVIGGDGSVRSFNERNSPLTDDRASDAAYDPFRDEIWITTTSGINRIARTSSSGQGAAAAFYVYPSPFCPEGCGDTGGDPLRIGGISGAVDGEIADLTGRIMARFFDARDGDAIWDGEDASGRPAGSGLYFVIARSASGAERVAFALVR